LAVRRAAATLCSVPGRPHNAGLVKPGEAGCDVGGGGADAPGKVRDGALDARELERWKGAN